MRFNLFQMQLSGEEIKLLREFFAGKPVKKAYQSVSYAANQSLQDGGLDILLELDYSKPIGKKFLGWHAELETILKKKVRLVASDGISPDARLLFDNDKVLLYER